MADEEVKFSMVEVEEVKSEMEKVVEISSKEEEERDEIVEIENPFSDHPHDNSSDEDSDSSNEDGEQFAPSFTPYYGSKDDDEDYKTPEYKAFATIIAKSRGYEIPPRPANLKVNCSIVPTRDRKSLNRLARIAIKKYNQRHRTEYKFDRVIKGNLQAFRGLLYYITFAVVEKGSDAQYELFEALVCFGYKAISVLECHPRRSTISYDATDPHLLSWV